MQNKFCRSMLQYVPRYVPPCCSLFTSLLLACLGPRVNRLVLRLPVPRRPPPPPLHQTQPRSHPLPLPLLRRRLRTRPLGCGAHWHCRCHWQLRSVLQARPRTTIPRYKYIGPGNAAVEKTETKREGGGKEIRKYGGGKSAERRQTKIMKIMFLSCVDVLALPQVAGNTIL